ncbi:MAG: hypothetical protein PF487_08195 [Bacteroidales bacterium]|jgi:hypothetical protein|nr:hypothetical protein [Bacteroidales bacterium]
MAIAIKNIPVLTESVAKKFNKTARKNLQQKETIDFTEQIIIANQILAKAQLK